MTKALPYIYTSFGYGTWFFFASWMLLASTWAFFMLPETKGLTLAQMDIILYVKPQSFSNPLRKLFLFYGANLMFLPQRIQLRGPPRYPPHIRHNQTHEAGS